VSVAPTRIDFPPSDVQSLSYEIHVNNKSDFVLYDASFVMILPTPDEPNLNSG
jgi:hypothetical protein